MHLFDTFYETPLAFLYPLAICLVIGSAELGMHFGRRQRGQPEFGTPTGAALGLLALLLGFSFSLGLARFDARRTNVLDEANDISTVANYAQALPQPTQNNIIDLLHQYVEVRIGLGIPFDPIKFERDVARSVALQAAMWNETNKLVPINEKPSMNRFVNALSALSSIHEKRVTALRYHVPGVVTGILLWIAMIAMGFTGYHAGTSSGGRHVVVTLMALMVAIVLMLIVDLDRPARGMIRVSIQPLLDAQMAIPAVNR